MFGVIQHDDGSQWDYYHCPMSCFGTKCFITCSMEDLANYLRAVEGQTHLCYFKIAPEKFKCASDMSMMFFMYKIQKNPGRLQSKCPGKACVKSFRGWMSCLMMVLPGNNCMAVVASPPLFVATVILCTIHSCSSCSELHLYFSDQRGFVRRDKISIGFWLLPLSGLFSALYWQQTPSRTSQDLKSNVRPLCTIHTVLLSTYHSHRALWVFFARFAAIWPLINSNLAFEVSHLEILDVFISFSDFFSSSLRPSQFSMFI